LLSKIRHRVAPMSAKNISHWVTPETNVFQSREILKLNNICKSLEMCGFQMENPVIN
jgi:hypothetical protein